LPNGTKDTQNKNAPINKMEEIVKLSDQSSPELPKILIKESNPILA
jgi:hypothetical protein